MPIYEYQCSQCGEVSEFLQKVSDEPMLVCPHCEEAALRRKVSTTSFQLKGSGWYVTDFKDKGKKKEKADQEKKSQTEQTSESSSQKKETKKDKNPQKTTES